jgi:hypothetical protein
MNSKFTGYSDPGKQTLVRLRRKCENNFEMMFGKMCCLDENYTELPCFMHERHEDGCEYANAIFFHTCK